MASTGATSPGTAATRGDTVVGIQWTDPSKALTETSPASDITSAQANTFGGNPSDWLDITNFGFSIPAGATVDGIEVETEFRTLGGGAGAIQGQIRYDAVRETIFAADTGTTPSSSFQIAVAGGSSDLLNFTGTAADVNKTSFGVGYRINGSSEFCGIEYSRMTIHYTSAEGGKSSTISRILVSELIGGS